MADVKISALPASTTPLVGTEAVPIVQSGVTKRVSIADLTAGRAVSAASMTLSTGNLVIGTSGQGVDFSATPGTGTSELLADYEEGIWTPSLVPSASGSITLTTAQASYTKVGRAVTIIGFCVVGSVSSPVGILLLQGLPFTSGASPINRAAAAIYATGLAVTATTSIMARVVENEARVRIEKFAAGSVASMAGDVQANTLIQFNLTYFV
jgi:hypothetical protein